MSTIADLLIKVRADTGGADKDISSFGSKVGRGFNKALLPATAALGAMGIVGKAAFGNLQDGAKNAAQTEQVIKTTGGAAGVTAKHVDDLSMSLRRKAGVDDDVVHSGANMLLTFTNVRNEVGKGNDIFDQATTTMLDMSQALGQDTKSSAIQLGKALNDPVKGVTALQRVGVSFTAAQKEQIKTMVATGDTLGAQKLILGELNKEFGGAATHIDPMQRSLANLKLDAVDLASSLLSALMPAMQVLVGTLGRATSFMQKHETAAKIIVGVVAALAVGVLAANAAMAVWSAGQVAARAATVAYTATVWLLNAALAANPIGIVIIALIALGVAIAVAWKKSETFRRVVTEAWEAVKSTTLAVFNAIKSFFKQWWPLILGIATGGLGLIIALVIRHWDSIKTATTGAWNAVKSTVSGAITGVVGFVTAMPGRIVGALTSLPGRLAGAARTAWQSFRTAVDEKVNALLSLMRGLPGRLAGALGSLGGLLVGAGSALIGGLISGITSRLSELWGKVSGIAGKIKSLKGPLPKDRKLLIPEGQAIIAGLIQGMDSKLPSLHGFVSGIAPNVQAQVSPTVAAPVNSMGGADSGDVVLMLDGEVLARFNRRELYRKGRRNVGLNFGGAGA